jgi:hypothetical protein
MVVLLIIILNMMWLANAQSNSGTWISGSWNSNKWISERWNSNADYSSNPNSYISIVKSNPFILTSHAYSIASKTSFSNHNSYISIVKSNPFITTSHAYSIVSVAPTLIPTLIPTTFAPTAFYPNPKTIVFETTTTLSGFPDASLSDQEQTVYIVAFSTSINIDSEMVKIVKQEIANRRLTYNIDVTTRITYPYVSDPQYAYNLLVQQIQSTGTNFTSLLKSAALKMGIDSFSNVTVVEVQVSPLLNDDDKIGKINPRHHIGTTLVIIMIVSALSVFVALIVYLYKQKRGRNFDRLLNLQRMSKYFTNERCINERTINERTINEGSVIEPWGIESCVIEDSFTEICITEGCVTDGPFTEDPTSNNIQSIVD